jgi:hypothetical protein
VYWRKSKARATKTLLPYASSSGGRDAHASPGKGRGASGDSRAGGSSSGDGGDGNSGGSTSTAEVTGSGGAAQQPVTVTAAELPVPVLLPTQSSSHRPSSPALAPTRSASRGAAGDDDRIRQRSRSPRNHTRVVIESSSSSSEEEDSGSLEEQPLYTHAQARRRSSHHQVESSSRQPLSFHQLQMGAMPRSGSRNDGRDSVVDLGVTMDSSVARRPSVSYVMPFQSAPAPPPPAPVLPVLPLRQEAVTMPSLALSDLSTTNIMQLADGSYVAITQLSASPRPPSPRATSPAMLDVVPTVSVSPSRERRMTDVNTLTLNTVPVEPRRRLSVAEYIGPSRSGSRSPAVVSTTRMLLPSASQLEKERKRRKKRRSTSTTKKILRSRSRGAPEIAYDQTSIDTFDEWDFRV